jgi:transcriptional regulator with XRE-family HTH domain
MKVSHPNQSTLTLREAIGSRLRSERERLGLTQSQLAERLGVIRLTIVKYEAGTTCPSIDQIVTLKANHFDTDLVVDGCLSLDSEVGRRQFSKVLSWVQREAEISGLELDLTQQINAAWSAFDQLRRSTLSPDFKPAVIESAVQSAIVRA